MENLFIVFVFILIILTIILIIWAVIDIFKSNLQLTEKLLWIILIILAPIIGSLIYFLLGRKRRESIFEKWLLNPSFHLFHNIKCCRTYCSIPDCNIWDFMKIFSIGMRVFPASLRSFVINGTVIICSQKRTGNLLQHKIILFIQP